MRRILVSLAAFLIANVLTVPAATAGDLTDNQQKEIGEIVRQYLLKNPEVIQETMDALQKRQQDQQVGQAKLGIKTNANALFRSPLDYVAGNPAGSYCTTSGVGAGPPRRV